MERIVVVADANRQWPNRALARPLLDALTVARMLGSRGRRKVAECANLGGVCVDILISRACVCSGRP
jgi:hypothetical protein